MEKPKSNKIQKQFLSNFLFKPYPTIASLTYRLPSDHALPAGCIIDIETTGLDPAYDKIITLGILKHDIAQIHQLTIPAYNTFKLFCLSKTEKSPKPRYAYAAHFEQEFIGHFKDWQDLTQYAEREYINDFNPYYRLRLDECTLTPFQEPDIEGREAPAYWETWLQQRKPKILYAITYHCLCDLLRTRQLIGR
jgi:hypothetical protein